jgi:hypothetical protein
VNGQKSSQAPESESELELPKQNKVGGHNLFSLPKKFLKMFGHVLFRR